MNLETVRHAAISALVDSGRLTIARELITDDTPITAGGLGLSSIAFLQAFVLLEGQFSLTFDDAAVFGHDFSTVGDFVDFLDSAIANKPVQKELLR
jgi:acyl carrier protein